MAFALDLLVVDGLPVINNGDVSYTYSDNHHVENLLFSRQGDWREFPQSGINVTKFINEVDTLQSRLKFERIVSINLKRDGYTNIKHLTKSILNPIIKAER